MIKLLFLTMLLLVDPLIWYKSMSNLGLKFTKRKGLYVGVVGIYYSIICFKQLGFDYIQIQHFSAFIDILMPLFIVSATLFLFKGSIVKKIMSVGVFYSSIFLGDSICFLIGVMLLGTPMEVFLSINPIGIFWTIISKFIVGTICWIFFCRGNKSWINSLYDNKEIVFLLLINMVYEIPLCNLVQNKSFQRQPSIMISFALSQIVLFSSFYYFWHVLKLKNRKLYTLKCELEVAKQNAAIYKTLRQLKHDMLGHVRIMRDLCVQKKYDKLKEYMDGMYGSIKQADTVYYLPDPALSILIGQLKQKSLENGIRFRIFNTVTNYYLPSHELC